MFTFEWTELVSDAMVARLYAAVGREGQVASDRARVVSLLATLFRAVGGVPLSDTELDAGERDALAAGLVDDACSHALSRFGPADTTPGFLETEERILPFARRLTAHAPVHVNRADAERLAALPEIGPGLATRIVAGRHSGGPYTSADDLADRVLGVGPRTVRALAGVLSFASPAALPTSRTMDPASRFATVAALAGGDALDPVIAALDFLCTVCGARPHPASAELRRRQAHAALPAGILAEWVAPLIGGEYHVAIARLFDAATTSIEVCMFHVALGTEDHPTTVLLRGLVAAAARAVAVRVLLDRDRLTDPYNSTVINRPAKVFLEANGVPVRSDAEDRLLHSKFVVVDRRTVVIGSHNWSIGSFHEFDDVSLAIASPTMAESFASRFDALWDAAS